MNTQKLIELDQSLEWLAEGLTAAAQGRPQVLAASVACNVVRAITLQIASAAQSGIDPKEALRQAAARLAEQSSE